MVDSLGIISYSPNNPYAKDYYSAYHKYEDINRKLVSFKNNDRVDVSKLNIMSGQLRKYKTKLSELTHQANMYESNIKENARKEQYNSNGSGTKLYFNA